jgi:4-amino-4-deoxy-L-arabinose transferase-like glycosyltransferase
MALLSLALYLALILPTLSRQGVGWDEQVDRDIARSYGSAEYGWFSGSGFDASQTRLPMYLGGVVFAATGRDSLWLSRILTVVLGALTLTGVIVLGRRALGPGPGEWAALLLATSPYFLSFARIAFTESDLYVTAFLVAFLICTEALRRTQEIGWALASGMALGGAVSSKLTAASFVLLALAAPLFCSHRWEDSSREPLERRDGRVLWAGTLLLLAGILTVWWWGFLRLLRSDPRPLKAAWLVLLVLWAALACWMLRRRRLRLPARAVGPWIAAYAAATFFLVPPVHLTEPDLLLGIARRAFRDLLDGGGNPGEFAVFYATCLVFKSSPAIGAGLLIAPAAALWQARRRHELRLLLAALGLYGFLLLRLPLAQTFYLVPLLPILALLAADQGRRLGARRWIAAVAGVLAFGWLALDLARCYPDFNLNGYQYLGERRVAGRATLGYRSVVQVTTDGTEQALGWVADHVEPGSTVVTYLLASHIVHAVELHDVTLENGLRSAPSILSRADYVVIALGSTLSDDRGTVAQRASPYDFPYDPQTLQRDFMRALSVRRAFGLEVASVWKRRLPRSP